MHKKPPAIGGFLLIIQLLRCEPQLFDMTKSVYFGVSCEILQLGSAEAKEFLKSRKKNFAQSSGRNFSASFP